MPEEQERVRDIFDGYDGGMTMRQIANPLNTDDYQRLPHIPRARCTSNGADGVMPVYSHSIRAVLNDCRYQGRIPHGKEEWPCAQLLVDGKPIIEEALWERVQKKLAQRRPGAPVVAFLRNGGAIVINQRINPQNGGNLVAPGTYRVGGR